MDKHKTALTGVLLGQAETPEKAKLIITFFMKCPYSVHFMHHNTMVCGVVSLPREHKWWFQSIAENPRRTVGLEKAEVFFSDYISVQSPWSSGLITPTADKPPCGADCHECPVYKKKCTGCVATKYYKG